jgi:hypothetical protein
MDKAREAHRIAAEFQCKVAKCLESTLASEELLERTRVVLAQYTASRGAIDDLKKIVSALADRRRPSSLSTRRCRPALTISMPRHLPPCARRSTPSRPNILTRCRLR